MCLLFQFSWTYDERCRSGTTCRGCGANFERVDKLRDRSWSSWATFSAGLYIPYGWHETMWFYEIYAMGMPLFVPAAGGALLMHMFPSGFNSGAYTSRRTGWNPSGVREDLPAWETTMLWSGQGPGGLKEQAWPDAKSRSFYTEVTDFARLPELLYFDSYWELMAKICDTNFAKVSAAMKKAHRKWTLDSATVWLGVFSEFRAL